MLVSALRDAGLTPEVPDGAYYILADCAPSPAQPAPRSARRLLPDTGVAAVSGAAFFRARRTAKTSYASASPKKTTNSPKPAAASAPAGLDSLVLTG